MGLDIKSVNALNKLCRKWVCLFIMVTVGVQLM